MDLAELEIDPTNDEEDISDSFTRWPAKKDAMHVLVISGGITNIRRRVKHKIRAEDSSMKVRCKELFLNR